MGFKDLKRVKANAPLIDLVVEAGLASSKREAREFIKNGAITLNGDKATDFNLELTSDMAIGGRFIVMRRGKKKYAMVEF